MNEIFGTSIEPPARYDGDSREHVVIQRPLRRVLAFTRRTIDDVINDPIARNEVRGYFSSIAGSSASPRSAIWNGNGIPFDNPHVNPAMPRLARRGDAARMTIAIDLAGEIVGCIIEVLPRDR